MTKNNFSAELRQHSLLQAGLRALLLVVCWAWLFQPAGLRAESGCFLFEEGVCVNLGVEVSGAAQMVRDTSSTQYWQESRTYQGENTIKVSLQLSLEGGTGSFSLVDVSYADAGNFQGPVELLPELSIGENTIEFDVDLNSLNLSRQYLPVVLALRLTVAEGENGGTYTKGLRLVFYPKQITNISYVVPDATAVVHVYEVNLLPSPAPENVQVGGVEQELAPVTNALIKPFSEEDKFLFIPESQTTKDGMAIFDVVANTGSFSELPPFLSGLNSSGFSAAAQTAGASADPAKLEDKMLVSVSNNGQEDLKSGGPISRYYAVVDAVQNGVYAKGPLGGDYQLVKIGDRFAPGTVLMLKMLVANPHGRILKPYVRLKFYDNITGVAELLNQFENDPNRALYIKLGEGAVDSVAPCSMIADASNFMKTVAVNPNEYGRIIIYHGIGTAVSTLTGGSGWIVSKTLGKGSEWLVRKFTSDRREVRLSQTVGPVTRRMGQGSAYSFESVIRNQEIVLYNRGADLSLSDGSSSVSIPERSSVAFRPSGAVSDPRAIFPDTAIPIIPVTLSPATGGSLYSCIQVGFSNLSLPGPPEPVNSSFRARLNGKLVSPFMRVNTDAMTSFYCPPAAEPLRVGENVFWAAISTKNGGRSLTESRFQAAAAVAAAPKGLRSLAGADKILLFWDENKEAYVNRYQVFRAATSAGAAVMLGESTQPVYAVAAADAGGYYALRACDVLDRCSPESDRLPAALNPDYLPAVPVLASISAAVAEDEITITVAKGAPAPLAWRLEKAESALGPYSNIVAGQGLIVNSAYTVSGLAQGTPYWFRAIPVGGDLSVGTALQTGPWELADLPPAAPEGLSVEFDVGAARVEWNPAAAQDVVGYWLYRSSNDGPYERIGGGVPIINDYYADWVESDQRLSWKVQAVDAGGQLSEYSEPVSASTWGLGYPGVEPDSDYFIISAAASAGGRIEPAGDIMVTKGAAQTFRIYPEPGYRIDFVVVDGTKRPLSDEYVFANVQATHSITASFAKLSDDTVVINPAVLKFGNIRVGQTSRKRLRIRNNSSRAIKLRTLRISGKGRRSFRASLPGPVEIGKRKSIYVNVVFGPRSRGDQQGLLTARWNRPVTAGPVILKGRGRK